VKTIGLVVLGAMIGALAASTVAQELLPEFKGASYSYLSWERYDMSVGVTTSGIPLAAKRLQHPVTQLNLPDYFGDFVGVSTHGEADVLWFRDNNGFLRSAIVPDAANTIYRVVPVPATNLEIRQKP
jgi:hypothetical protein